MSRRRTLLRYLAARLALAPLMLWLISSLVFLLLRLAPGDPIDALLGTRAPESARAALRAQLGLDQPLLQQYGSFLGKLLHGDLGASLTNQEPVTEVIRQSLPASLELGVVALLLAGLWLREPLSLLQILGAGLAVAGMLAAVLFTGRKSA